MSEDRCSVTIEFFDSDALLVGKMSLFAPGRRESEIQVLQDGDQALQSEERIQIFEATKYEYDISPGNFTPKLITGIGAFKASSNPKLPNCGSLELGAYVGRLGIALIDQSGHPIGIAAVEVLSRKIGYRDDLRTMIEEIADRAIGLAFELRAPTTLRGFPDPSSDSRILYQQFAFLNALLGSKSFGDAIHYITMRPHERLDPELVDKNISMGSKLNGKNIRELVKDGKRFPVPIHHPLSKLVPSLPSTIQVQSSKRTEDNPENRFVRFALESFYQFLEKILYQVESFKTKEHIRLVGDVTALLLVLETALSSKVLSHVSRLDRLPLESPVLHSKEGYREIFQAWLKFDLSARLIWEGGADIYNLGRRDVATLYEYWVFFKLLDLIATRFLIETPDIERLIEDTGDHLGIKLKSGRTTALRGQIVQNHLKISVRFDFNRIYSRRLPIDEAGSWTQRMRPDYSLTFWTGDDDETSAEINGRIVRIHFDAKYRIDDLTQLFGNDEPDSAEDEVQAIMDKEVVEQINGIYKRVDLLKMHAYRDAIRRSNGAYVLYPGSVDKNWTEYHEILPGIGAFVLRPGNGDSAISKFINDIIDHISSTSVQQNVAAFVANSYKGLSCQP